ncbi:MAG: hypothetical protein R2818_16040 [Flavobacteriales bacterium]
MPILERNGQLRPAAKALLHAVSRVPMDLLDTCRVLPRKRNWLSFPWYSARSGGGAFVLGRHIYVSGNLLGIDRGSQQRLLFLLAHEVGHLPHAAGFKFTALGRTRFVIWSALHYAGSYLRHGRSGYRKARIEQEAERGRWVLEQLFKVRPAEPAIQELFDLVLDGNQQEVAERIVLLSSTLQRLHVAYPGW